MSQPGRGRRPGADGAVQWGRALALIAVLVIVGVFILNRTGSSPSGKPAATASSTTTTTVTTPAPTTTTPSVPASQVKVQVLNGVLTGSLAGQWSTKLKSQYGYQTQLPDNATAKVSASIIYVVTPGYDAEARQLAARIGLSASAVSPTLPTSAPVKASEAATANLVLIIGPDLAGSA